jgi:hypothetical protein
MQDQENATPTIRKRAPWNKGKLTGAKPPLRPKHVWSIRTKLQMVRQGCGDHAIMPPSFSIRTGTTLKRSFAATNRQAIFAASGSRGKLGFG